MVTSQEKERLLRIAKRTWRGPFDAVIDPTELGHGSALLELSVAVKHSGKYNIWAESGPTDRKVANVLRKDDAKDFIGEIISELYIIIPRYWVPFDLIPPLAGSNHRHTESHYGFCSV